MSRRVPTGGAGLFLASQAAAGTKWVWASSQARTATAVTAADVGAIGTQSDLAMRYRLISQSGGVGKWAPLLWEDTDRPRGAVAGYADVAATTQGSLGSITSGTGTAAAPSGATKSLQAPRISIASAGAASFNVLRGSTSSNIGGSLGLRFRGRGGLGATVQTDGNWFFGLSNTTPPASVVNPNTLTNAIGFGSSGDASLQAYTNAAGTATKYDIGLLSGQTFEGRTASILYDFDMYTVDGTSWVLSARHVNTGVEYSFTASSNLPSGNVMMFLCYGGSATGVIHNAYAHHYYAQLL